MSEQATRENEPGAVQETRRDKVRRLLFGPLGFRHPKRVSAAEGDEALNRIADEIGYMSDRGLVVLAQMLRGHGQGSDRNFWPDRASFIGFAELVEPRPMEDLPALLRWFGSVEGPRAIEDGTLVETWEHFVRYKTPPVTRGAKAMIAERAYAANSREALIGERLADGREVSADDLTWRSDRQRRRARIAAIVERERAARQREV